MLDEDLSQDRSFKSHTLNTNRAKKTNTDLHLPEASSPTPSKSFSVPETSSKVSREQQNTIQIYIYIHIYKYMREREREYWSEWKNLEVVILWDSGSCFVIVRIEREKTH